MTVLKLTPKQKLFLEFLRQFEAQHGYAPSQQEIAKHFGFKSLGTVQDYLNRLEEQGALQKTWNARRSTSVTAKATAKLNSTTTPSSVAAGKSSTSPLPFPTALTLPIEGKVAAGRPIEATSQNRSIDVPATLIPARFQQKCTALQVVGDSMIDDGIQEDDYVIIRRQEHAENGQTVVALLGGTEATIKRYFKKPGRIELHSANSKYKPIVIEESSERAEGFRIAGVLMALFRKF
ncbi:MAG: transcriptional repressor LexA [Bdellovibrionales bacterium]|nr:transcriptional repressor LexA [Bdellovibrionales bacterium]